MTRQFENLELNNLLLNNDVILSNTAGFLYLTTPDLNIILGTGYIGSPGVNGFIGSTGLIGPTGPEGVGGGPVGMTGPPGSGITGGNQIGNYMYWDPANTSFWQVGTTGVNIGVNAGVFYSNTNPQQSIAIGINAVTRSNNTICIGTEFDRGTTGIGSNMIHIGIKTFGYTATITNFSNRISIGNQAGIQSTETISIGNMAGGTASTAGRGLYLGSNAGYLDQAGECVVFGTNAGYQSISGKRVAIGSNAGFNNAGTSVISIGTFAGAHNASINSIAVGYQAGCTGIGSNAIAIGYNSGVVNQVSNSISIGSYTNSKTFPTSVFTLSIGSTAGSQYQNNSSIAIGSQAGEIYQGLTGITGHSIAIGTQAGQNSQGPISIAIGTQAGQNSQGPLSIAIGTQAGQYIQGTSTIAIGYLAGCTGQGNFSTAIGPNAGTFNLSSSAIVLNASSTVLNPTTPGFFVDPINSTGGSSTGTSNLTYSDGVSTAEIFYNTVKTFVIDHPIDNSKRLIHSCLEGPEVGVYYRGKGKVINNKSVIYLPEYIKKIANDLTVQLTPVYNKDKPLIKLELLTNEYFIVSGDNCDFFWLVQGCREKINVEMDKNRVSLVGKGPYKWIV